MVATYLIPTMVIIETWELIELRDRILRDWDLICNLAISLNTMPSLKRNPRVTLEVTRDVCLLARMMAANLYYSQIEDLMFELSMWRCSDELRVRDDELHRSLRRDAKHYIEFWKQIPPSGPYRAILGDVRDRLYQTRERSLQLLSHCMSEIPEEANFTNIEQILEPLELCYRSLCSCGDRPITDESLFDFLRQVSTFWLSLVRLDIRQKSNRHTDILDAITKHLEIGSY
ncbi:hypothetical protein PVK06_008977 [Gossypium arboreum]|uniref:Uncharacterized protein n=1 Tax=Gossypium arboreum TaxID=29729 RepID=A0ABR0QLG7_GOSAR|nr:hypothetical protein PVK06_008977 [Gossypium arboreum]